MWSYPCKILEALPAPGVGPSTRPVLGTVVLFLVLSACTHTERLTDRVARHGTDRAGDRITEAMDCVLTDQECREQQQAMAGTAEGESEDGDGLPTGSVQSQEPPRPGEGAWANYDFIPGERILFAEDFSADRVGDFPRRLEFVQGNLELVEWSGDLLLRSTGYSRFRIPLGEELPDRFTVEFNLHKGYWNYDETAVIPEPYDGRMTSYEGSYFEFGAMARGGNVGVRGRGGPDATAEDRRLAEEIVPVRIMVDGTYAKVFLDERRVANVPNAAIRRGDAMEFRLRGTDDAPSFISDIRIAAGGRDLYRALEEDGRIVTRGIYFDTGHARVRPESTGTLDEIGRMLGEHPGLRLRIEGHTDSVGPEEANQELSERRATAVRDHLIRAHDVDADRLEAVGFGESRPIDSNDTPEGRQNNRRVELVRIDG